MFDKQALEICIITRRIQMPAMTRHHGHLAELCNKPLRKADALPASFALALLPVTLTSTHTCNIGTERCVSNRVTVKFCLKQDKRRGELQTNLSFCSRHDLGCALLYRRRATLLSNSTFPEGTRFPKYPNGEQCTAKTSDHSGVTAGTEESCQEKPGSVTGLRSESASSSSWALPSSQPSLRKNEGKREMKKQQ